MDIKCKVLAMADGFTGTISQALPPEVCSQPFETKIRLEKNNTPQKNRESGVWTGTSLVIPERL
jgi:hypothetical protein